MLPSRSFYALVFFPLELLETAPALAQQAAGVPSQTEASRLEAVERDNSGLRRRLDALEKQQGSAGTDAASAGTSGAGMEEESELSTPGLSIHRGNLQLTFQIFGDVAFRYQNPPPEDEAHSSFAFGSFGLFTAAKIGDHFEAVSETVLEGEDDSITIDMERLWGKLDFSDLLYAKLGLEHTSLSRWNRLYHNAKYFEPTIERPFLARFEDDGGILPMHFAGIELGGHVETGIGRMEYLGSVNNGRGPMPDDRQRVADSNDEKALEGALIFSPSAIPDLHVGGAVWYDEIPGIEGDPARARSIRAWIETAFVDYRAPCDLETLGEVAFLQNKDHTGGGNFQHVSGYFQVGYEIRDRWTPYTRFDIRNMDQGDPYYSPEDQDLDLWEQVVGVRYDFMDNAVLKLEAGFGNQERRSSSGNVSRDDFWIFATQLAWFF